MNHTAATHRTAASPTTTMRAVAWIAQLGVVGILVQALFLKLSHASEMEVIFGQLGGPPAIWIVAVAELIAIVSLLIPRASVYGALVALGLIGGAVVMHLTVLGIVIVNPETGVGDDGLRFGLALLVVLLSGTTVAVRCGELHCDLERLSPESGVAA